jgi:hypothetical protein
MIFDFGIRSRILAAALAINLALSGCVTQALWNAAEGAPAPSHGMQIRSVTRAYKSSDGNFAYVCMSVFDFAGKSEREMTLSIPVQNHRMWQIQRNVDSKPAAADSAQAQPASHVPAPTYIEYAPAASSLMAGCMTDGAPLPVLVSSPLDSHINMQPGQANNQFSSGRKIADAIYVVKHDGLPINIGYVADKPLFENSYSIDVPLQRISDLPGPPGKPYLYLLTPVTVAMDAAIVVLYVAAVAYSGSGFQYHNQQPPLTIKGTSLNDVSK